MLSTVIVHAALQNCAELICMIACARACSTWVQPHTVLHPFSLQQTAASEDLKCLRSVPGNLQLGHEVLHGLSIKSLNHAVTAMLELGSKLVAEHDQGADLNPSKTKFGFHTPPFLTVSFFSVDSFKGSLHSSACLLIVQHIRPLYCYSIRPA